MKPDSLFVASYFGCMHGSSYCFKNEDSSQRACICTPHLSDGNNASSCRIEG